MHGPLLPEWRVAGKAGVNAWCLRGLGCGGGAPWIFSVEVKGLCVQRMSLKCCSHWPVARLRSSCSWLWVGLSGRLVMHGDWFEGGGRGGLGIQGGAWGGRGGGCMGGFIGLMFLLTWRWDCALVWNWWVGGGGGRGVLPKDVGVLAVAAL